MNTNELTNDAKAILLLCGRFGKSDYGDPVKPLSLREYNQLADWLMDRKIRPADLLEDSGLSAIGTPNAKIDVGRIRMLLKRGAAMAFAIEKWTNNGIWVVCRSDAAYPERLKKHLKKQAPSILYGVGDIDLLTHGGLAVVGSRKIDGSAESFTREVATECARQGIQIISGGAHGVDQTAMLAAMESGGTVVGILADSLLKAAVARKYCNGIREKRLTLISPYYPDARFTVSNAMSRNKYIYAMADYALIVSAELQKGGTWAGAVEELRRDKVRPLFVCDEPNGPEGNRALIQLGSLPFPSQPWKEDLVLLLKARSKHSGSRAGKQVSLFDEPLYLHTSTPASVKENVSQYSGDQLQESGPGPDIEVAGQLTPVSIYDAILPVLLDALNDWKSPKEVAASLEIRKNQLDAWLRRAAGEGRIEKKNRPIRYRRVIKGQ